MSQSNRTDPGFHRALADLARPLDRQADVERLLRQVSDVRDKVEVPSDEGPLVGLRIRGAHNAGFEICVVIEPGGNVGWSLR